MKTIAAFITVVALSITPALSQELTWTVMGDASVEAFSAEDFSGGFVSATVLRDVIPNLQAGARVGIGFGDMDGVELSAAARYFAYQSYFAYAEYPLTEDAGEGLTLGLGRKISLSERIKVNPALLYNLDEEIFGLHAGFAIRF
ncbi:MAG: hypothetical protein ACPGQT_03155 [Rhodothermales bacterium]